MCQIYQREGTVSFAAIRRVLRGLFAKNHEEVRSTPPPTSARVNFNPRLAGMEYLDTLAFFRRYLKNGGAERHIVLAYLFIHIFAHVNISDLGHSRQIQIQIQILYSRQIHKTWVFIVIRHEHYN